MKYKDFFFIFQFQFVVFSIVFYEVCFLDYMKKINILNYSYYEKNEYLDDGGHTVAIHMNEKSESIN